MRSRPAVLLLGCVVATPAGAQQGIEWQGHVVSAVTAERFVGAGPGVAWRTTPRLRFGAAVSGGVTSAGAAVRVEGTATFHLTTTVRPNRIAPYVGGGAAMTADDDGVRERLLVVVGIEGRPGRRAGWFLDVGAGGGLRLSVGFRLRPWGS